MPSNDKKTWSSFGELFKELREKAGVTLEELSETSKIQITHLKNLEEERFDSLPPYVYVRGFIQRSCAVFTQKISEKKSDKLSQDVTSEDGVNSYEGSSDKLTRLFISRVGFYNTLARDKYSNNDNTSKSKSGINTNRNFETSSYYNSLKSVKPKVFITPAGLAYFFIACISLLVLVYLSGRFVPFLFTPEIELSYPTTENIIVNFSEFRVAGHTRWAVSLTVGARKVYIGRNGEFEEKVLLNEGVNMLVIEAKSIFGRSKEVVRRAVYIKN